MKFFRKHPVLFLLLLAILVLLLWTLWGNTALTVTEYTIQNSKIPSAFDGFRIAQVSDLHNAQFGADNEKLLALLADTKPDMIAITGDLIDSRNTDIDTALQFVREAVKIAPCYYVTGNHEARIAEYDTLRDGLIELGVTVLEDGHCELTSQSEKIKLIGINDPSFSTDYLLGDAESIIDSKLQMLHETDDPFTILLSHRPELFQIYVKNNIGLALTGHAHGGQIRLPHFGGLFAPNQGFFPEYDSGLFTDSNTQMIVSRGIGNSLFPFRINNRPEVILIELKSE